MIDGRIEDTIAIMSSTEGVLAVLKLAVTSQPTL
jgi:hypothetical protein